MVVNFVNKRNAADQRVYALLKDKFKLFEGVFGASDEVLGALESGVDLEKRIAALYQTCRTTSEIDAAFTQLQLQLEEKIETRMADTRRKLFENFDEEVHDRLKVSKEQAANALSERTQWLANLIKQEWAGAVFDPSQTRFSVGLQESAAAGSAQGISTNRAATAKERYAAAHSQESEPIALTTSASSSPLFHWSQEFSVGQAFPPAPALPSDPPAFYNLDWRDAEARNETFLRLEHPLAQEILARAQSRTLPAGHLRLDYHSHGKRIAMLEPLLGQSGWLLASKLTVKSFETEEFLLLSGTTQAGTPLTEDHCKKLLALPAHLEEKKTGQPPPDLLQREQQQLLATRLAESNARNGRHLDEELAKLDHWAEDLKMGLEYEIKEMDKNIREARRQAGASGKLEDKLAAQKNIKSIESARNKKRRELFEAQDKIERQRDDLILNIEKQMQQKHEVAPLFVAGWSLQP